jgi:hypothetical protein
MHVAQCDHHELCVATCPMDCCWDSTVQVAAPDLKCPQQPGLFPGGSQRSRWLPKPGEGLDPMWCRGTAQCRCGASYAIAVPCCHKCACMAVGALRLPACAVPIDQVIVVNKNVGSPLWVVCPDPSVVGCTLVISTLIHCHALAVLTSPAITLPRLDASCNQTRQHRIPVQADTGLLRLCAVITKRS